MGASPKMAEVRAILSRCLLLSALAAVQVGGCGASPAASHSSAAPAPQGAHMARNIVTYAHRYWARVSGRDAGARAHVNGHDEFAAHWQAQALAALHGTGAVAFRQSFPVPGFSTIPARKPGINVIVMVPGSVHPEQAVVVGTHYDGEPTSKGSAYDDTSGSMILLALARAMGKEWRAQGRPQRTVEFVLFDAEEQGLVGSVAYRYAGAHGALLPRTAVMINEEQSGIAYPVRPFGLLSEAPLPSYAVTNGYPPPRQLGTARPADPGALRLLTNRLTSARAQVFTRLQATYSPLSYRGGTAPVFGSGDLDKVHIGPDPICCSDNAPFQLDGIPTVTFAGESGYYASAPPAWSYPFDQPQDTAEALACDTGGSPTPGTALQAALDIPLGMSTEIVNDYAPPGRGSGTAVLSTLPRAGASIHFVVAGAASPSWTFGDGASARGASVRHTYKKAGTYTARVAGRALRIKVPRSAPRMTFPFGTISPPPVRHWQPPQLAGIAGCGQG